MHNGFLSMGDTKMSKSLGNVVGVNDLLAAGWRGETHPPCATDARIIGNRWCGASNY